MTLVAEAGAALWPCASYGGAGAPHGACKRAQMTFTARRRAVILSYARQPSSVRVRRPSMAGGGWSRASSVGRSGRRSSCAGSLSRTIVTTQQQVQEALSGDEASFQEMQIAIMQGMLRRRQQCMVAQVAALYPVRVSHDQAQHAETLLPMLMVVRNKQHSLLGRTVAIESWKQSHVSGCQQRGSFLPIIRLWSRGDFFFLDQVH